MAFNLQVDAGSTSDANAYIDVTFYKAYHADRGVIVTTANSKIEANIILATDYLDHNFSFKGARLVSGQTTEWPRENAYNNDGELLSGLPTKLKEACAAIAIVGITNGSIYVSPTIDASGKEVKKKTEGVGPLTETTEYFGPSDGVGDVRTYPIDKAESLLSELVSGSLGSGSSQQEAIVV